MPPYSWPNAWRPGQGSLRDMAARSVTRSIAAGTEPYDRLRHLPRLIPVTPEQVADDTIESRRYILARLARALREERARGRAGHWTYDLNRHIGLRQAFSAERRLLGDSPRHPETHPPPKGGG